MDSEDTVTGPNFPNKILFSQYEINNNKIITQSHQIKNLVFYLKDNKLSRITNGKYHFPHSSIGVVKLVAQLSLFIYSWNPSFTASLHKANLKILSTFLAPKNWVLSDLWFLLEGT